MKSMKGSILITHASVVEGTQGQVAALNVGVIV